MNKVAAASVVTPATAGAQASKAQLIDVMSAFVNHLIQQQAANVLRPSDATTATSHAVDFSFPSFEYFCAEREPGISVEKYCERLVGYMRCTPECFVFALAYLRRAVDRGFPLSTKSVHRMLITALVVAAKTRDDHYYSMHYYAQVGGVTVKDLNCMEVQFLVDVIQFRANVCVAEYRSILAGMDRAFVAASRLKATPLVAGAPSLTPDSQSWRPGNSAAQGVTSMHPGSNSLPSKGCMHPSSSTECDSHGVSQSTTAASSPKSPVTPLDRTLHVASPCCSASALVAVGGRGDRLAATPIHAEWISTVGLFA